MGGLKLEITLSPKTKAKPNFLGTPYLSYSLSSSKGGYIGAYIGLLL